MANCPNCQKHTNWVVRCKKCGKIFCTQCEPNNRCCPACGASSSDREEIVW